MDALVYGLTATPQQVATAAEQVPGVRAARILVGGNYQVFAAIEGESAAVIAAVVQNLVNAGFLNVSVNNVLPPPVEFPRPWSAVDQLVNLVCSMRVEAGTTTSVFVAVTDQPFVTGAAVVMGDADVIVKMSFDSPTEVAPALMHVSGFAGIRQMTSAYAVAP